VTTDTQTMDAYFTKTYSEVVAIADEHGIDPDLLIDVLIRETELGKARRQIGDDTITGDRDLTNKAYGPMQIRKPALNDVNRIYNTSYTEEDLKDEDKNLAIGSMYLKALTGRYWNKYGKRHDNANDYAYAAYRHGPGVSANAVRTESLVKPRGSLSTQGINSAQDHNKSLYDEFIISEPAPPPAPQPVFDTQQDVVGETPSLVTTPEEPSVFKFPEFFSGLATSAQQGLNLGGSAVRAIRNPDSTTNTVYTSRPNSPGGGGGDRGRNRFALARSRGRMPEQTTVHPLHSTQDRPVDFSTSSKETDEASTYKRSGEYTDVDTPKYVPIDFEAIDDDDTKLIFTKVGEGRVKIPEGYELISPNPRDTATHFFTNANVKNKDLSYNEITNFMVKEGNLVPSGRPTSAVGELVGNVLTGVATALPEIAATANELIIDTMPKDIKFPGKEWFLKTRREKVDDFRSRNEDMMEAQDTLGHLGHGIGKFFTGWSIFRPLTNISKLPFLGRAGSARRDILAGALTDASAFKEEEGNLMAMAYDHGVLPELTEWFKADPDDKASYNKLKNAAAGAFVGATLHMFLKTATQIAKIRKSVRENEKVRTALDKASRIREEEAVKNASKNSKADQIHILNTGNNRRYLRRKIINPEVTKQVYKAAAASETPVEANLPIFRWLTKQLATEDLHVEALDYFLTKYNLSAEDFAREYATTVSLAGKELNQLSQLSKKLAFKYRDNPEALKFLKAVSDDDTPLDQLYRIWQVSENVRRGAMVSQLVTATRNFASQAGRFSLNVIDEVLQSAIRSSTSGKDALKMRTWQQEFRGNMNLLSGFWPTIKSDWKATMRNQAKNRPRIKGRQMPFPAVRFTDQDVKQVDQVIDEILSLTGLSKTKELNAEQQLHAAHITRMISAPVQETMGGTAIQVLNWANAPQELFWRRAVSEGKIRQLAARKGYTDINNLPPNAFTSEEIEDIVRFTLETTFAASPRSAWGREFVRKWRNNPALSLINPFPRFMFGNALPYMFEHSPLGFIALTKHGHLSRPVDMLLKKPVEMFKNNPKEAARITSRGMLGSALLWSAWELRQSEHAGEKWYELNELDDEGRPTGRVVDARSYSPLAASLLYADTTIKVLKGDLEWSDVKNILKEGSGLSRPAGTAIPLSRALLSKDPDVAMNYMQYITGQYIGTFGIPFRQVADFTSKLDLALWPGGLPFAMNSDILRSVKENGVLAPFFANLPVLQTSLPPHSSPFHGDENYDPFTIPPIRSAEPIKRQYTGLNPRFKSIVEREVDRLKVDKGLVYAKTGDSGANRLINGHTGQLLHHYGNHLLKSPRYRELDDLNKKWVVETLVKQMRTYSRILFNTYNPEAALAMKIKNKFSRTERELMEGIGILLPQIKIDPKRKLEQQNWQRDQHGRWYIRQTDEQNRSQIPTFEPQRADKQRQQYLPHM